MRSGGPTRRQGESLLGVHIPLAQGNRRSQASRRCHWSSPSHIPSQWIHRCRCSGRRCSPCYDMVTFNVIAWRARLTQLAP